MRKIILFLMILIGLIVAGCNQDVVNVDNDTSNITNITNETGVIATNNDGPVNNENSESVKGAEFAQSDYWEIFDDLVFVSSS